MSDYKTHNTTNVLHYRCTSKETTAKVNVYNDFIKNE